MWFFFDEEHPEAVYSRYSEDTFEDIKHVDENGEEFWYARELQKILEYTEWRNFKKVINKAVIACKSAGNVEKRYFVRVNKIVKTGIGEERLAGLQNRDYQGLYGGLGAKEIHERNKLTTMTYPAHYSMGGIGQLFHDIVYCKNYIFISLLLKCNLRLKLKLGQRNRQETPF